MRNIRSQIFSLTSDERFFVDNFLVRAVDANLKKNRQYFYQSTKYLVLNVKSIVPLYQIYLCFLFFDHVS